MTDRHLDLRAADIGALNPPSTRRMIDFHDKREAGLVLRAVSKAKGDARRAWTWRYRDGAGKQRRMVFGHWPKMTYEAAVKSLREARRTRSAGADPIDARSAAARALSGRMTVSDLIDRYVVMRAPSLKSGDEVVRLLKKHIAPAIGALAVADVTSDRIKRLLGLERERMARDDIGLRKAGLKPRTFALLARIHASCGSVFTFAVDQSIIATSPTPKLKRGGGLLPNENPKGARSPTRRSSRSGTASTARAWTNEPAMRFDSSC